MFVRGSQYPSLSGEASKLVIDNYLRSLAHGNKYVFQTLPKVLTLWLEHASTVGQPFDPKRGDNEWDSPIRVHVQLRIEVVKSIKRFPSAYIEPAKKEPRWHAHATEKVHNEPDASGSSKYAILVKTGKVLIILVVHNTPSSGRANLPSKLDSIWSIDKNCDQSN